MSVQLIVYPQTYEGEYNSITSVPSQILVDGVNFTTVDTASDLVVSTANHVQEAVDYYNPIMPPNTWSRYHTAGATAPYEQTNQLNFNITGAGSVGIMQRITNLTAGAVYEIKLAVFGSLGIFPKVYIYSGTILQNSASLLTTSGTTANYQLQSPATSLTFVLDLTTTSGTNLQIFDTISIATLNSAPSTPSNVLQILGDGQVICDLYEDEDIPLSLSVDDFKNVAEKVQSYSKAFKLPATKRNNLIFDDMFEITRTAQGTLAFNPYNKTECVLKQDSFILFKGYLRMLDINDKDGEISYNVNLYSEVVALADILKDRTFSELDFTELTHDYQKTNIKRSWNDSPDPSITYTNSGTSGFRDAYTTLRYPFVDWNHQFIVADNPTGGAGPVDGFPQLPNLESAFRPFIQLKYLINRIFAETPFTWESSFFDSADFGKLYMDFNWGADNAPSLSSGINSGGEGKLTSLTTNFTNMGLQNAGATTLPLAWNTSTNKLTATLANESYIITYTLSYYGLAGDTQTRQWVHKDASGGTINTFDLSSLTLPSTGAVVYSGSIQTGAMQPTDTLQVEVKTTDVTGSSYQYAGSGSVVFSQYFVNVTSSSILQTLRGELGQWDFIKGIMTMFNLVSLPDEDNPNNIKFETYADIFHTDTSSGSINDLTLSSRSIQHDWTDRIDVAEMKLTPLTDLNKDTIFKFVEDEDDFCFMEYKRQVGGHLYGSLKYDASIASNGLATVLQGTKEVIAEPFAATIIKPLMTQYTGLITPAIYAMSEDETEGFDNSPRILYNNGRKSTGASYFIPAQNGLNSENQEFFLQFSHLSDIPTIVSIPSVDTDTNDFHFGECQLPNGLGLPTTRNLYNLYWAPYYNELYNPDTRIMTIKVNLSPAIINTFKFNDTVMIKNREFRVNKIDYKPNDLATVEFILIP